MGNIVGLQGWITALGGIGMIAVGVGTILVTLGGVAVNFKDTDWAVVGASCKSAFAMIAAGIATLGLGKKLDKIKEAANTTTTAVEKK